MDDVAFGQFAVTKGYLSADMLGRALQYQRSLPVHKPLGEILLEKNVLSRRQVQELFQLQRTQLPGQVPGNQNSASQTPPSPYGSGASSLQVTAPLPPPPPAYNLPNQPLPNPPYPIPNQPGGAMPSPQYQVGQINFAPSAESPRPVSGRVPATQSPGNFPPPLNAAAAAAAGDDQEVNIIGRAFHGCTVTEKLGEGGMGAIFLARNDNLDKKVVVKILPPKAATKQKNLERFRREAKSAAKLDHPNIVQVLHVDETEDGLHYIVMQFIDGRNLNELIQERGAQEWRESTRIILDAAKGLRVAHDNEIIHRDIKAENIMVTNAGIVKVADFGLAKDLKSNLKLTADGAFIGTPLYMAPEIGREVIDGRVDIFSLGITYYYLLTGVQPFKGFKTMEILSARAHDVIKDPLKYVPDLPKDVRRVLGKMICKDRSKRYLDMNEVISDLENLQRGQAVKAPAPGLWGEDGSKPEVSSAATGGEGAQKSNALLYGIYAGAVLVLILIVVVAVYAI
jgi:tRNA A-37 threonylcarbamoyl transferase component Bud32